MADFPARSSSFSTGFWTRPRVLRVLAEARSPDGFRWPTAVTAGRELATKA